MARAAFLSITDQAAAHLRSEIQRGRWGTTLPGKHQLAMELGLNHKTIESALRQLEVAGLLLSQGRGRRRQITASTLPSRVLRIGLLLNELEADLKSELHAKIARALTEAGHTVVIAPKSLTDLRFDPKRIVKVVQGSPADAWIVYAGSREVLEWFALQSAPSFALFGHRIGIKMAAVSPDKPPAVAAATRHLIELGHRRIVLLCRRIRRLPAPGLSETVFLETLRAFDSRVGDFNLPDWEETNAGFQHCLDLLFRLTPPTALIVDEAPYFVAAMQFLLKRGLRVPQDVSLICTDNDPAFAHCDPPITSITWENTQVVRRIVQWAGHLSRGKVDVVQTLTPATFIVGGTTGPAQMASASSHG